MAVSRKVWSACRKELFKKFLCVLFVPSRSTVCSCKCLTFPCVPTTFRHVLPVFLQTAMFSGCVPVRSDQVPSRSALLFEHICMFRMRSYTFCSTVAHKYTKVIYSGRRGPQDPRSGTMIGVGVLRAYCGATGHSKRLLRACRGATGWVL